MLLEILRKFRIKLIFLWIKRYLWFNLLKKPHLDILIHSWKISNSYFCKNRFYFCKFYDYEIIMVSQKGWINQEVFLQKVSRYHQLVEKYLQITIFAKSFLANFLQTYYLTKNILQVNDQVHIKHFCKIKHLDILNICKILAENKKKEFLHIFCKN